MNKEQLEGFSRVITEVKNPLDIVRNNLVMLEFLLCFEKVDDQGVLVAIEDYKRGQTRLIESINKLKKSIVLRSSQSSFDYDI